MLLDKQKIIDMLNDRGEHRRAERAMSDLPDQVDTDLHSDKLSHLGLAIEDVIGGPGGIGEKHLTGHAHETDADDIMGNADGKSDTV